MIKLTRGKRAFGLIVIVILLSPQPPCRGQAAHEAVDKKLETILGSAISEWRIGHYSGTTDDYKLIEDERRPVLVAGPNATLLTGLNSVAADSEVTVRLRLGAAEG